MGKTAGGKKVAKVVVLAAAVALLAGCAAAQRRTEAARLTMARVNIGDLNIALALYYHDTGGYPSEKDGLKALLRPVVPGQAPYVANIPADPWGRAYRYRLIDNFPQVDSAGPDGVFGTADDVHD